MGKEPLVSIVLPTYNRAPTLQDSIQSILKQSYGNFEILIVDDGSKDHTERIVNWLKKKDPRIQYIRHPRRLGANVARNTGIRQAKGELIAFQDSDDQWHPDKLSLQVNTVCRTGVPAVFTGFWRIQGAYKTYIPKKFRSIKSGKQYFHEELLRGNFIALPSFIVKKSLLNQTGNFDEALPRFQDWELFLRLSKITDFYFIDKPLLYAHIGKDNITAKKELYSEAMELVIKKHEEAFNSCPNALIIQLLNLAADGLRKKDFNCFIHCIKKTAQKGVLPLLDVVTTMMTRSFYGLFHRKNTTSLF